MRNVGKAIACLKALGFKPSVGDFEDRLKVQKVIYLLKLKGVDAGFKYNLYVRGPYSPDLTQEIYSNSAGFEGLHTGARLTQKEAEIVHELKERFEMKSSLLEVAATYGYYVAEEGLDPIAALKSVKRLKPFFSEAQIAVGISQAKEFLFRPPKEEEEAMRKEHAVWEKASLQDMED